MKLKISKQSVYDQKGDYWNQINELLALTENKNLDGIWRNLQHLYWVYSEVVNGGFEQYFENWHELNQLEVAQSFITIGANKYHQLFLKAYEIDKKLKELYIDEDFNESEIDNLETEILEIGFLFDGEVNALDFIENYVKEHESILIEWVS